MRVGRYLILLAAGFALALPFGDAAGVSARAFTVNSTADEIDVAPGDAICRSSSGKCTLRAALNEASAALSDGKALMISVPAGEYKLQIDPPGPTGSDGTSGDLDLASPAGTPPPSITIQGGGVGKTIVTQTKSDRVFEISARSEVTISGLTIRGGSQVRQGGGVISSDPEGLTLEDVEIAGNAAEEGGGVYSSQPLIVQRARIAKNHASGAGGGIAVSGRRAKFVSTAILGNRADRLGGGLWLQNVESADISQSLVVGNVAAAPGQSAAASGGGIDVTTDPRLGITSVRIEDSTIRGNSAAGSGGGLRWEAAGTLSVVGSLFAANTAEVGGGIATASGSSNAAASTLTLTNTTISGNAAERGGGIERSSGSTILRAVTIAGNTASTGSGIDFDSARPIYAVATGTIVANMPASRNCGRGTGAFAAGDSLSAPGTNLESGTGCHLGAPDLSGTDPLLAPLANNGGRTQTRAPRVGSPAVDRYTAPGCPTIDQRGYARPAGSACDIGALEQSAARPKDAAALLRISQEALGGTFTLIPRSLFTAASLGGRDFRPCTGRRHLNEPVAGGFFESGLGQISTRGTLIFRRNAQRVVRVGHLLVLLDGPTGRVLATVASTSGALSLFDLFDIRYGNQTANGRLRLTAAGAALLNRGLGLRGFRAGMECGRFSVRARIIATDPFVPKPPPPPPTTTTTTTTTTKTTTTTTTPSTFKLTASIDPSGSGAVISSPSGILCGSDCTESYKAGTVVKVTANPDDSKGYKFDHWEGSCTGTKLDCSLTMSQDRTVKAIFVKK